MSQVLVVYGTKYGQSRRIAEVVAEEFRLLGHRVDLFDVQEIPRGHSPQGYDVVWVGGGVHASGYPPRLVRWLKKNAWAILDTHSAFFSVCLGILEKSEKTQREEEKIMKDLFFKAGWYPPHSYIFAGALPYTKYNWFIRRIMRNISEKAGGDTDTTRDYEYTDWNEVKRSVREFNASLPSQVREMGRGAEEGRDVRAV